LGEVAKWYVFLIFLQAGVDLLDLGTLSLYLDRFVMWLPNVIIASLLVIFGLIVIHIICRKIEEHTEMNGVEFISKLVKVVLITLIVIISLQQIGVNVNILENLVLLIVGAVAIGIAIALGIGLGGALKDDGRNIVRDKRNRARLRKEGWIVIRFWEHRILKRPKGCINRIVKQLQASQETM